MVLVRVASVVSSDILFTDFPGTHFTLFVSPSFHSVREFQQPLYPRSSPFDNESQRYSFHPTQKPITTLRFLYSSHHHTKRHKNRHSRKTSWSASTPSRSKSSHPHLIRRQNTNRLRGLPSPQSPYLLLPRPSRISSTSKGNMEWCNITMDRQATH